MIGGSDRPVLAVRSTLQGNATTRQQQKVRHGAIHGEARVRAARHHLDGWLEDRGANGQGMPDISFPTPAAASDGMQQGSPISTAP